MTANMIKGKGFGGALRYNLEKVEKGVAEILDSSFASNLQKSIMKEMQMVKMLRPNLQKHFYHTSINFPPSENLSNEKMRAIGREYLEESGFTQHQFIMFRHHDADHPHLHILVSRIGYDGQVMSDSNDFAKCEVIMRSLEKKHNLAEVVSSKNATKRAATKNELEMMKRTRVPSNKMRMQKIISDALNAKNKLSCLEFVRQLERQGVNVLFNQASTGYVSGISYSYQNMTFTGSKLGTEFKWTKIRDRIDYDQERDRKAVEGINTSTKSGLIDSLNENKLVEGQKHDYHELKGDYFLITKNKIDLDFEIDDALLEAFTPIKQPDLDPESTLGLKKYRKGRRHSR